MNFREANNLREEVARLNDQIYETKLEYDSKIAQMQKGHAYDIEKLTAGHKAETEALAEECRKAIRNMDEAKKECENYKQQFDASQGWFSELQREHETLRAKDSMKDEIILNLSRNLKH